MADGRRGNQNESDTAREGADEADQDEVAKPDDEDLMAGSDDQSALSTYMSAPAA